MATNIPKQFNKETGLVVDKGEIWIAYQKAYFSRRSKRVKKPLKGGTTKWDLPYYTWLKVYKEYMNVVLEEMLWNSSTSFGMYAPPGRLGHFRIYCKKPVASLFAYDYFQNKMVTIMDKNGKPKVGRRIDPKRTIENARRVKEETGESKGVALRYLNEHTDGNYYTLSWVNLDSDDKPYLKDTRFKKVPSLGKRMSEVIFEKPLSIVIPRTKSLSSIKKINSNGAKR